MATSDTEICNMALAHLGVTAQIASLGDAGPEGEQCTLWYDQTRKELLKIRNWPFAKRQVALALTGNTAPDHWEYEYAYPSNCLRVRFLFDESYEPEKATPHHPYRIAKHATTDSKIIWTDLENACAMYTFNLTTVALFDDLFVNALSYALAHKMAYALTTDRELKQEMFVNFARALGSGAAEVLAEQQHDAQSWDAGWIDARTA